MIKVFIVDDSALMRTLLTELLTGVSDIQVIGSAQDPIFAQQKMADNWPDVIILDLEMPRMDGMTFLRQLMKERPTPVIVCSALSEAGSEKAIESLREGAIEVMGKPKLGVREFLQEEKQFFIDKIRSAAQAKLSKRMSSDSSTVIPGKPAATADIQKQSTRPVKAFHHKVKIIGIGASTGGTQALEQVLLGLTPDVPGIVIVQHMPEKFTHAFAERINSRAQIHVKEAKDGDMVLPGQALIAPGGLQMQVLKSDKGFRVSVKDGPPVNRHKPSVDVLFRSLSKVAPGSSGAGIILTGMGNDGARGLAEMHDTGSVTAAQDKETCVVFGMPNEAIKLGAADYVLPLDMVSAFIHKVLS